MFLLPNTSIENDPAVSQSKPIDARDRAILRNLLSDGRLTIGELAERVGLSPSPCWQRVRRMEVSGLIKGYSAILDSSRLGVPEIVIVEVTLDRHDDEALEEFGKSMARFPEVLEVYLTTGDYDYLIKVAVSGTQGYEEFLRNKLYRIRGLRHSRSSFALRCLKHVQAFVPDMDPE